MKMHCNLWRAGRTRGWSEECNVVRRGCDVLKDTGFCLAEGDEIRRIVRPIAHNGDVVDTSQKEFVNETMVADGD